MLFYSRSKNQHNSNNPRYIVGSSAMLRMRVGRRRRTKGEIYERVVRRCGRRNKLVRVGLWAKFIFKKQNYNSFSAQWCYVSAHVHGRTYNICSHWFSSSTHMRLQQKSSIIYSLIKHATTCMEWFGGKTSFHTTVVDAGGEALHLKWGCVTTAKTSAKK